jgi:poly(3-hydroxybutyrate) depolymerase
MVYRRRVEHSPRNSARQVIVNGLNGLSLLTACLRLRLGRHSSCASTVIDANGTVVERGGQGAQKRGSRTEDQLGDVPFFEYMLDKLAGTYSVDPNRIFATGYSDGGIMVFRLGRSMSGRTAAVAPVAGALPKEMSLHCELSHGVPLLMIDGTSDPVVPYGGGHLRGTRLTTLPVKTAAARWAELDRCALKPTQTALPPPNRRTITGP